jgi:hypothetical protein
MLRPDVGVVERARLVLGKDDDLAGALGESFEHDSSVSRQWFGNPLKERSNDLHGDRCRSGLVDVRLGR